VYRRFPETSYIFGSRTDRQRRGGDIDIMILNTTDRKALDISTELNRELFKSIEMQWDVIVYPTLTEMNPRELSFFQSITKIPL
jgi:predicted nucleotidyltransferase